MYLSLRKINPRAGLRCGPEEQLTGALTSLEYEVIRSSKLGIPHAPLDNSGEM